LLQLAIEPIGVDPIYLLVKTTSHSMELPVQANVILNFLADSRRYLAG
jgi:hypothetical protein